MIHEEDLTKEQNEFVDALENADERMQRVFREMKKEGVSQDMLSQLFSIV